jgi:hypothetical protein
MMKSTELFNTWMPRQLCCGVRRRRFTAELNRQRVELWRDARERLKSLANRALDVVELQLNSDDPKAALAAAKYILQGTQLLGDTDLELMGPTSPERVILEKLEREAYADLAAKVDPRDRLFNLRGINDEAKALAMSRLKKAMAEAGLA